MMLIIIVTVTFRIRLCLRRFGQKSFYFQGRIEQVACLVILYRKLSVLLTFQGKHCFHFYGRSEQVGNLVVLCRPCYGSGLWCWRFGKNTFLFSGWKRTYREFTAHRHILSLSKGVHQHKEKNNGLSGWFFHIFLAHRSYGCRPCPCASYPFWVQIEAKSLTAP